MTWEIKDTSWKPDQSPIVDYEDILAWFEEFLDDVGVSKTQEGQHERMLINFADAVLKLNNQEAK